MKRRMRLTLVTAVLATLASVGSNGQRVAASSPPEVPRAPAAAPQASSAKPTIRLPAGAPACPSRPDKPSSAVSTCTPGTAGEPNAVASYSRPAGRPACPQVSGKAQASGNASCDTDTVLSAGAGGADLTSLPPGMTACPPGDGKKQGSGPAACGTQLLPDSSGGVSRVTLPAGQSACPPPGAKPGPLPATCSAGPGTTGSPTGSAADEVLAAPTQQMANYSSNGWVINLYANPNALAVGAQTDLHAVANQDVGPTPWYIQIYDNNTGVKLAQCYAGTTCDAYPSQSGPTTHTFIAYVDGGASTPTAVQAWGSVNVTWLSVSLGRSSCCVGPGGTVTLTAYANTDVGPTPWYIEIFDSSTGGRLAVCYTGSSCSVGVSQPSPTTHSYMGFVSANSYSFWPAQTQAVSGTQTVTWLSLSLSASPQYMSPGSTTTLTAAANADILNSPYYIQIYNSTSRTRLASCASGSVCRVNVSYWSPTGQNYVAYISDSSPNFPPGSIQVLSNTVYAAWYTVSLSDQGNVFYLAPNASVTLSAYAVPDVGATATEYVYIYDVTTRTILMRCGSGGNCGPFNVSYGQPGPHTFTAYIAGSTLSGWPPPGIVATSNSINVTWLGVSLSANRPSAPDGQPITLTAAANVDLSQSPYTLQLFDASTGVRLSACSLCSSLAFADQLNTAATHAFQAFIATDSTSLPPPNTQASATLNATWLLWGVDSCDHIQDDYSSVVSNLGKPEFWGRYIGGGCAMTASEATFAHGNGAQILPVYNEMGQSALYSTATGQQAAANAASYAVSLGIPAGTVITLDIEGGYSVDPGSLQGWADTITSRGYKAGFYENPNTSFGSAFCTAASDTNVANSVLWSNEPNPGRNGVTTAPSFGAYAACGHGASIWQYYTNPSPGNTLPNVDDDEMLAGVPLW